MTPAEFKLNQAALNVLASANRYLTSTFTPSMTKPEANAHFDARAILIRLQTEVLRERARR